MYNFHIIHKVCVNPACKEINCPKLSVLARVGEPEPGVFGSLEPEPLEKKTRSRSRLEKKSGAGAAKKLAGSSALRKDKKHKEIVL